MKKIVRMLAMAAVVGAMIFSVTACGKSGTAILPSEALDGIDKAGDEIMNAEESAYAELESVLDENYLTEAASE